MIKFSLRSSAGLNDKIFFKDFVPNLELPQYYNAADIGVWPGAHSITVIEAIATGLPVIVPENDLAYKVLFDNDAAVGFEKDANDLAEKLYSLIKNEEIRYKISTYAVKVVREKLSWEVIAKKSIEIYKNM